MPFAINLNWAENAPPTDDQKVAIQYARDQWVDKLANNLTINIQVESVPHLLANTNKNALCIPGIYQTNDSTLTRPEAKLTGHIDAQDDALDLLILMSPDPAAFEQWVLGTGPIVHVGPDDYSLSM